MPSGVGLKVVVGVAAGMGEGTAAGIGEGTAAGGDTFAVAVAAAALPVASASLQSQREPSRDSCWLIVPVSETHPVEIAQ